MSDKSARELKKVIVNWLFDHYNAWQRVSECRNYFRQYICDEAGNYIIGGQEVSDFISHIDKALFA